jgi:o-succinylbenzoate---CoA ligase
VERDLVAVTLSPDPLWLELVPQIWAEGAALLPIDPRLPAPEAEALLRLARPTVEITEVAGEPDARRIDGGIPVEDDVVLVVHTSGTGGAPKLAEFDRSAVTAAVTISADVLGATPEDRWLCCLPLAHIGGLLVVLRGVLLGAPVAIHPAFDPSAFTTETGAVFTSLVPTMLRRLLDAGVDLAPYRAILVGGTELPSADHERAAATIVRTYGLTESCGGVVYDGRALPGVEIRLDDEGAIELRGPTLMNAYRSDPEATSRAFTSAGWLATGDVGQIDASGLMRVVGRRDELIISGGEKVWPQEVEAAVRAHPKVREVVVAGRSDPEWGERVAIWVVPVDPRDPPTLDDLRTFSTQTLARHKAPRELVLVEALPRTSSGKVRRADLPGGHTEPE